MTEITSSNPPPWCAYVSSSTTQALGDDVIPMVDAILLTSVNNCSRKGENQIPLLRTVVHIIETSSSTNTHDDSNSHVKNHPTKLKSNNGHHWIQLNPLLASGFLLQQQQSSSTKNSSSSSISSSSPFVLRHVETDLQKEKEYNIPIDAQKITIRKLTTTTKHNNNDNHNKLIITLSLVYTTLWTSNNNNNNNNNDVSNHTFNKNVSSTNTAMISKEHFQRALEGRLILPKSFLLLSIATSPATSTTSPHYALVYIDKVTHTFTNQHTDDQTNDYFRNDNESHCIELGKHDSFTVDIRNTSSLHPPPYLQPSSLQHHRGSTCPGYESMIQQIIDIACLHHNLSTSAASPSAVLITGCAGVGKTQLALAVASRLSSSFGAEDDYKNNSTNQQNNYIVKLVSAKDIILRASTFMEESKLVNSILPQSFSTTHGRNHSNQILVLDDLQEIFYPESNNNNDSETVNKIDSERLAACNAVTCAIDKIISSRESIRQLGNHYHHTFILGLYRTSSSSSSHSSFTHSKLTRVGRFEKILQMTTPTEYQRTQILNFLFQQMNTSLSSIETQQWSSALSPIMAGCVASDLQRMCKDAWTRAQARQYKESKINKPDICNITDLNSFIENESIVQLTWDNVQEAARSILPSQLALLDVTIATRTNNSVFTPNYNKNRQTNTIISPKDIYYQYWDQFGGYKEMKEKLYRTVVAPWKRVYSSRESNETKKQSQSWQVLPPSGLIFHGPSGTGKTFAAHCLACALGLNVIKVRASDVLDKWLGGSEAAIRSLFARARSAAPCILFFDEIDALATNREEDNDGDASCDVHSRVLSTMLNEIDGISSTNPSSQGSTNNAGSILVMAATNRLSAIDAALLRPGRLEEHIILNLPSKDDIMDIIDIHFKKIPISQDIDLNIFADTLHKMGATGADIEGIFTESCLNSMRKFNESHNNQKGNNFVLTSESLDFAIRQWKAY